MRATVPARPTPGVPAAKAVIVQAMRAVAAADEPPPPENVNVGSDETGAVPKLVSTRPVTVCAPVSESAATAP